MKSADVSTTVSSSSGFGSVVGSSSSWGPEYMSITIIWLNGCNYPPQAKSVEVYLMAKGQDKYLIDAPPDHKDPSSFLCHLETQGCSDSSLYVEYHGASNQLIYYTSSKQVWDQAKEMFSSISNLWRTYDLHQTFFPLTFGDMSLEDYYGRF